MYLFINELSFSSQANHQGEANELMGRLFEVIRELKSIKGDDPISTSRKLWEKEIAPGLTVYDWMNAVRKEKKLWFMNAVRKGPHVETLLDEYLPYHECLFQDEDVSSTSLAGAAIFQGILASLQRCNRFNALFLILKYRETDGDFQQVNALNAFDISSASSMLDTLRKDLSGVSSWKDFWEKRELLFPNLVFCHVVEKQLNRLNFIQVIHTVRSHLTKMNDYCRKVKQDELIPDYTQMGIDASGESNHTLRQFGYQREFECPDGKSRLFEWHSKQRGQNLRIHFYPPDTGCTDFLIGYVGIHLDTWKYH